MQTSCPECRTAFRVSQAQLGLRRGLVRCGKCNAVFNAYDTLLPELEEPPLASSEPLSDALGSGGPAAVRPESTLELDLAAPPSPRGADGARSLAAPIDAIQIREADAPETLLAELPEPVRAPIALPAQASEARLPPQAKPEAEESPEAILLSELPNRKSSRPRLPFWQRLGYVLIALPLLALLPLQAAYFFRADLVAAVPASRPGLERLCQVLGCTVPLPRQLGREAIAASNLEHNPEQKSRVRLTVLLANRTGQDQAWPSISLTLTDVREDPVAQKLFPPQAYLPQDTPFARGLADGSEREIRLDLDIGNLAATGYAVDLVYP